MTYLKIEDSPNLHIEITESAAKYDEKDVGIREKIENIISIGDVANTISKFSESFKKRFDELNVSKASIEFGLSFSIESGQLLSFITKGSGGSNIKINLEWTK